MQEAVDVAVQLKYDRIREESSTAKSNNSLRQLRRYEEKSSRKMSKRSSKIIPKVRTKSLRIIAEKDPNWQEWKLTILSQSATFELRDSSYMDLSLRRKSLQIYRGPKETVRKGTRFLTIAPSEIQTKTHGQTTRYRFSERPADQEFETGVQDEQAEEEVQHLPDWFQKPTRLPSPDHAWKLSVPAAPCWKTSNLVKQSLAQQDPESSFDNKTDSNI
ncbi:hypothetical protein Tco_1211096 [Tanacetum coccineum]